VFHYHDRGEETSTEFRPAELGIDQTVRAPRLPGGAADGATEDDDTGPTLDRAAVARAAAEAGLAALAGEAGATRDSLIYGAALCLWHLGRHGSLKGAAEAVRGVLDRAEALERLQRMRRAAR
jgi:hypothetical protein